MAKAQLELVIVDSGPVPVGAPAPPPVATVAPASPTVAAPTIAPTSPVGPAAETVLPAAPRAPRAGSGPAAAKSESADAKITSVGDGLKALGRVFGGGQWFQAASMIARAASELSSLGVRASLPAPPAAITRVPMTAPPPKAGPPPAPPIAPPPPPPKAPPIVPPKAPPVAVPPAAPGMAPVTVVGEPVLPPPVATPPPVAPAVPAVAAEAGEAAAIGGEATAAAGGIAALSAAAGPAALAIAGIALAAYALAKTIGAAMDKIHTDTVKAGMYNSAAAGAAVNTQIREMMADIDRANRIGDKLAAAEESRSRISQQMTEIGTTIEGVLLDVFTPLLQTTADCLEWLVGNAKKDKAIDDPFDFDILFGAMPHPAVGGAIGNGGGGAALNPDWDGPGAHIGDDAGPPRKLSKAQAAWQGIAKSIAYAEGKRQRAAAFAAGKAERKAGRGR